MYGNNRSCAKTRLSHLARTKSIQRMVPIGATAPTNRRKRRAKKEVARIREYILGGYATSRNRPGEGHREQRAESQPFTKSSMNKARSEGAFQPPRQPHHSLRLTRVNVTNERGQAFRPNRGVWEKGRTGFHPDTTPQSYPR